MMAHVFDPFTRHCTQCACPEYVAVDGVVSECVKADPVRRIEITPAGVFYSESPRFAAAQYRAMK